MSGDTKVKHTYNTRSKNASKRNEYAVHESSSSSSDEDWEDEDEEEFNENDYQKLLSSLFPSNFMSQKNSKLKNKEKTTKSNKSKKKKQDKKKQTNKESSDEESCNEETRDEETSEEESSDEDEICNKKIKRKQINKTSKKHSKKKIAREESSESETESEDANVKKRVIKKSNRGGKQKRVKRKKSRKKEKKEECSESESDDETNNDVKTKLNIILSVPNFIDDEYLDYEDDSEEEDSEEEDSEEEDSDEEDSDEEDSDEEDSDEEDSDEEDSDEEDSEDTKNKDKKDTDKKDKDKKDEDVKDGDVKDKDTKDGDVKHGDVKDKEDASEVKTNKITDAEAFEKFNKMVADLPEPDRNNSVMKSIIKDIKSHEKKYKKKEEKRNKKHRGKNTLEFRKLIRDKDIMNDIAFFKEKLSVDEQSDMLKQIEEVKKHSHVDKPYRLALLESQIPINFKSIAFKKISNLKHMEPGGSEYYKIKNWVDTFMQIPFGKYRNLPIKFDNNVEESHEFMSNAKSILDTAVYGLSDAKLQIMQMVGQWIVNPEAVGTAIAIKGPMGTGKTTLVKDGISKILGREFAFIALGGATDSSFLEGHSYTYEGSTWGKIVDILVQCKSMNPVIYFDELDKVSDTPKGEEITGILTHLTDTTQNNKFHDKYFSELDFDLSRCLFIFSYNDETKVNPILRDRMYRIQTKGYDLKEKTTISNDYLIPNICQQVKFNSDDIVIPKETIQYIVERYTDKEQGVRNLKRCLEIVHTKLNLYRLMKPDTNLFEKDMNMKITFPITVTQSIVDKLIKQEPESGNWQHMYM